MPVPQRLQVWRVRQALQRRECSSSSGSSGCVGQTLEPSAIWSPIPHGSLQHERLVGRKRGLGAQEIIFLRQECPCFWRVRPESEGDVSKHSDFTVLYMCGGLVSVQAEAWHPLPWNFLWFKVKIPSFFYDRGRQGSGQVPNVVGHPATVSA